MAPEASRTPSVMAAASLIFLSVSIGCAQAETPASMNVAASTEQVIHFIIMCSSLGKQAVERGKSLELDGVSGRVEEEHGGLFTGLTLEADVGFDDELRARCFQPGRQDIPLAEGQDRAEVANRDVVAVNGAGL